MEFHSYYSTILVLLCVQSTLPVMGSRAASQGCGFRSMSKYGGVMLMHRRRAKVEVGVPCWQFGGTGERGGIKCLFW